MNSKIKKLVFSTFAVLIAFNLYKAFFPSEIGQVEVVQEEKGDRPFVEEEVHFEVEPDDSETEQVLEAVEGEKIELDGSYERFLKELLPPAQKRDVVCSENAEVLFKDPSFIDVEDPIYKDPLKLIERLHDVYTKTLVRTEVVDAYGYLTSLVKNKLYKGSSLKPANFREHIETIEFYCRPETSLRFIETVMEANKRYKFSPRMKKDIFDMSISMLDSVVGDMYTTNNLIYGLGFFKLLVDNELLPKEVIDDISPLFDKVLEHHKGFSNTWRRDLEAGAQPELWNLLIDDLTRRQEFGVEFKDLIQQLRTRYYIR
ncbi:MAG: hypothetical protein ACJAT2_001452 [Bacteriovoracaceae bacterium]|jgi:hypothetical protein